MFWKYNNTSSSQIETLLCKEDVTLQDIMDEEDVINECKMQNKVLIDFLSKPEVMEELVTLITVEPSANLEERSRFKYPNIACELLTCDVPALNERLASDETLLAKLYNFLDSEPPLNPLLASFFSKIMGVLIAKRSEQVLDFLKAKQNLITLLLNHLGTSAIMDLVLKLMTQVEGVEMRQNILNWLDSQRIIQSLIALFNPSIDKERHYNVAQLLCDFVKIVRDNQQNSTERNDPDPLLNTLEAPDTVSLLLDEILGEEKCESAIVGGVQLLLALLDVNKISIPKYDPQNTYDGVDLEQKQKITDSTSQVILIRLKDFHNLLLDPPKTNPIKTTIGTLDPPLGNTRLQITKLIAAIILTNNAELLQELISLGTLNVLLDLLFKFPWNNFLHTQVQVCIVSALKAEVFSEKGDVNALHSHLLVNCKLIERVLGAWKQNDEMQANSKGIRQGYMGHLINIVNEIVELCSKTSLGQFLQDVLPEVAEVLKTFKETTLSETNKTQEILLGGVHPNTSNEDSDEYADIPYPQAGLSPQQMYAHYQSQQIAPKFTEAFSFNDDDDFNDGDDTLQNIDHRTGMNFDLSDNFISKHELFKQVCAQNINTLDIDDDDDQIFEERDHTFQTVVEKTGKRHNAIYGSDSEDDLHSPIEAVINVDPWSSPKEANEAPITSSDPWSGNSNSASDNSNWADFSSVQFSSASFAASEEKFKDDTGTDASSNLVESDMKLESVDAPIGEKLFEELMKNVAAGDRAVAKVLNCDNKTIQLQNLASEGDSTPQSIAECSSNEPADRNKTDSSNKETV